ncbi:MAG: sodium:proton exchanger [Zetaproteobacteria bacterium CG06_land_8_20_14_3_00_59_53]|nr:MAG: sodium:proton exchanger [Zetaproteobacteria bacterium CG2_30_59_37]PIO89067.1 MAG: sodium:proton exchanger [Zetaproteobacteria bacterium CG23_combo_of_CG06-09_8_20_14_all_59_86]PIQ65725.1 MAG: sodium:proton exchanger [Zetaproteobacteria bacterium CG11_big_fil_rev_8_21_14_0_20_59_439]PIU70247.1 MAG: sodium:proton exchanger [Zetaproteobacteria bacterium CG06_land_8_20_14_3_00_59_53]PIU96545.1 MAG: sodium:proton exchanger [Zetaproteobacteria bacterium CG03_land_8_20_14_0_80_59_51]PIY46123
MTESLLLLAVALVLVFVAAELFTNALEFIGERMGVSEGVTGSLFAAVGTAMPETIVPIVAILAGGASMEVNHAVGMGAILGAPFMLATLGIGIMALAAGMARGWHIPLNPEPSGLSRDLRIFLPGFVLVVVSGLLPENWDAARGGIASLLILGYFFYVLRTVQASKALVEDGHATEAHQELYAGRFLPAENWSAIAQLLVALFMLIGGARMFVSGAEEVSALIGVSAFIVSLLIVPVATELPEKVNSVIWIRRRKDTLAFGNMTGAMVFQGTVIPAIGMLIMPWHIDLSSAAGISIILTLIGAVGLSIMHATGRLQPRLLLINAALYLTFGAYVWASLS